jgi:serine/threonine-protein kinase
MNDGMARLKDALADRYVIERKLGEGGMATVYLAEDLKHGRQVAIKVLKPEISAVLGAERFQAEIQTTANLQHPNILPLFDSGEAGGQLFYVMPYVEGESLRDRLEHERQLPVDEAVSIVCDLAEALQTAHDAGIIHRDIKPANILLRSGKPLLADFGIALAVSAAGEGRLTETALSMGTPYYMSPEQAAADRDPSPATDVYSLGCVLYEMLTGEPPFPGSSAQAVLARILTGDPDPVTEHRKAVPANIEAAVLRAIEKLPADRFASAREFERALKDPSFRHGAAGTAGPSVGTTARVWKVATGAFAGVSILLAAGWLWGGRTAPEKSVERYRIAFPGADWEEPGPPDVRFGLAMAPDGSALVRRDSASGMLLLKERDQAVGTTLAGTESGHSPTFSPSGDWIAFFVPQEGLRKVPRRGGSAMTLAPGVATSYRSAAWLDDGTLLFNSRGWGLARVNEVGGEVDEIFDQDAAGGYVVWLSPLPGARGAFYVTCGDDCPVATVHVLDLQKREQRPLFEDAVGAWYTATGHVVYVRRDGGVFAAPFDLETLELRGPAVPVLDDVAVVRQYGAMQISPGGRMVYLKGEATVGLQPHQVVWVDRQGNEEPVDPEWTGAIQNLDLSPDGTRLAFTDHDADGTRRIQVRELPNGPTTLLASAAGFDGRPAWTPDGERVVFETASETEPTDPQFLARRYDASLPVEPFLEHEKGVYQVAWSESPDFLVYRVGTMASNEADLWYRQFGTDTVDRPLLDADFDEAVPALSPDGRWIAFVAEVTGDLEIYIRPFPDVEGGQVKVSEGGGVAPLWARDGSELFYMDGSMRMVAARLEREPTLRVVDRTVLFPVSPTYATDMDEHRYDVSLDGQRFLMIKILPPDPADQPTENDLILVENWFVELERIIEGG